MKKILIIFLMLSAFFRCNAPVDSSIILFTFNPINYIGQPDDWLQAITWVETGNQGRGAYNRNEPLAKGILQQYPIFVRDINKILGFDKYTLEDRLNDKKAIEMFWIYQKYYNPEMSLEKMCRIQCGGPDGYLHNSTLSYYNLVKNRLFTIL